jgi:glycosyltransferase involved in cell wall biosynthesis
MVNILLAETNPAGGMLHYASQLANALSAQHRVSILCHPDADTSYFSDEITIIDLKRSRLGSTVNRDLFDVRHIAETLKTTNVDVFHVLTPHLSLGLAVNQIQETPVVSTVHNPNSFQSFRKPHLWIQDELITEMYRFGSDRVIVHGENAKDSLHHKPWSVAKLFKDKNSIEVIPHGDYSFFSKWRSGETTDETVILFFGWINDRKGVKYLLKAQPKITQAIPNSIIQIAGRGDFDRYREHLECPEVVEVRDEYIPDEDVAELFEQASVVVLPYVKGSQSGVVPIAYAFSTPVVVTNVGSIPEVVEDGQTGRIVPPEDPEALSDAIIDILSNPKLQKKMGKNAHNKMEKELSWSGIAKETARVYNEIRQTRG